MKLQYHPKQLKNAKSVLWEKLNKGDSALVKSYLVISLLNFLGKVVEELVAEQILQFYESNEILHNNQMRARKNRSAINALAMLVQKVQDIWKNWQIVWVLLMDVKEVFDQVSQMKLAQSMADLGIDDDFIGWTKLFLSDR